MINAWIQAGVFVLVVAWSTIDHGDDGVEIPRRWLAEKQRWMLQYDPGLTVTS